MAGLGNLLAWIFAPLGFDNWQATATAVTGLVAKENVCLLYTSRNQPRNFKLTAA